MSAVIVPNTDNTALHTVSVQHAIRMLVREVAIVEEARDGHRIGPYPWPLVLRLIRYVKTTFCTPERLPGPSVECSAVIVTAAPIAKASQTLSIICCLSPAVDPTAGRTPSPPAPVATTASQPDPQRGCDDPRLETWRADLA